MRDRATALVGFAAAVVAVSLLTAGCGGGSSPPVASLGTTAGSTSNETTAGASGSGGLHSPIAGGTVEQRTKYATCMRTNGVPNFPDPDAQGHFSISPASGLDPRSAAFQHAQQSCQKLLPDAGQPSPAQHAQTQTELLALAQCLRKHGYPNLPDPDSEGAFDLTGASGLDPSSPQFQSAMSACHPDNGKVPFSIGIKATSTPGGKP